MLAQLIDLGNKPPHFQLSLQIDFIIFLRAQPVAITGSDCFTYDVPITRELLFQSKRKR